MGRFKGCTLAISKLADSLPSPSRFNLSYASTDVHRPGAELVGSSKLGYDIKEAYLENHIQDQKKAADP